MMSIEITEGLDIHLVKKIASHFDLEGTIEKIQKIGSGHIHKTFLIKSESDALLIQQVNHSVFLDLEGLQANLRTIEKHFKKYESYLINEEMSYLRLREANDQTLFNDGSNYWRAFEWIENSESFDKAPNSEYAFQAASGFGRFLKLLSDLPPSSIQTTIQGFHDGIRRWNEFESALEKNSNDNRTSLTKDLIVFAQQNRENLIDLSKKIHTGFIPIRLTHNDTKLNNILFHSDSPIVKCVIDLDTVMPGTLLFDFGDMVRTISCTATEDEEDLSAIKINEKYFMGICNGFAKEVKDFITQNEQLELLNGAKYICFIIGLRFLTDFLNGNVYYPVEFENHNLIRARNQFKIMQILGQKENLWKRIIKNAFEE